jgi:hypothetical protein
MAVDVKSNAAGRKRILSPRGMPSVMNARRTIAFSAWGALLLLICLGLGYPTLNRYDPTSIRGLSDSLQYYRLVQGGPEVATGHWRYRVLVPFLAKPVYWLSRGRLATWDPIAFSLLIVNAIFCAASAFLVSMLAHGISRKLTVAVVAAFAYLLNFTVSNYQLSALVDSADAFFFVLLTWALLRGKWALLPPIALLAAFSKETFVPIGTVFALTWLLLEPPVERKKKIVAVIVMAVLGLSAVSALHSAIDHTLVLPWNVASHERGSGSLAESLLRVAAGWNLWLTIIWLPFVFLAAKYIPKQWRWAALAASVTTIALFAFNDVADTTRPVLSGGNVARPLFDVVGALLAVSFALAVEGFH